MSKSEFLHYGCDILISIQSTSFINCSGFIDKSLYLSQSDDIPDVLQSVFRIFPKCEHENQSTLILSLSSPDALEFENAFSELSDLLDLEIKTNLENFYNCKGKEIKFGSTVYLQHAQSHKFLTIRSNNASLSEPDCFQVILTDFPEDSSFVVLQHCYNFQKEGNGCIQANDIVVLEFPKAKTAQSVFLTAAAEKTVIEQRFGTSFANEIIGSVDKKTF
jgi:Inositol 1,4,5-trisphosphate/ryanodine receptor.